MILSPKTDSINNALFGQLLAIGILTVLTTCTGKPDAESIIDKAIAIHGGEILDNAFISFDFRDKHYTVRRNGGEFKYERIFQDSLGKVRDVLTNDGFTRLINEDTVALTEDIKGKYANSVNAVIYLFLLPYGLNDEAVNKTYLGETLVDSVPYYEIKVTFEEQSGGKDHEDVYLYWINQQSHTMDYFAYAFYTDGGGTRFRKAINPRSIKGVRFADYLNYTYTGDSVGLDAYETLFEENKLKEVSRIVMENIEVKRL